MLNQVRPRMLLLGLVLVICILHIISQPAGVLADVRLISERSWALVESDVFAGVLVLLILLFAATTLKQLRSGQTVPWRDFARTVLIGPITVALVVFMPVLGPLFGLIVLLVPPAQLVWSIVRVVEEPGVRAPLIAGLLLTLWITVGLTSVVFMTYTGLGRM